MKSLVDNLLFYPMVQSSFLVLRSSYFLIDSCWVQSLIWHVPTPPLPPSLFAFRYTVRAEKCARVSSSFQSGRTVSPAQTRDRAVSPFVPLPRPCAGCPVRTGVPMSSCASSVPGAAPRISLVR